MYVLIIITTKPEFLVDVLSIVNHELATEMLWLWKKNEHKILYKNSVDSVRNTNKKLHRRDEQIANLKVEVKEQKQVECT